MKTNLFFVILILSATAALAQQPTKITVTPKSYTTYPSLEPVTALTVSWSNQPGDTKILDAITHALSVNGNWDCTSPVFYKVAVVDKAHKILREIPVKAARLQPFTPSTESTKCDGSGLPGSVDLILQYNVDTKDLLQVFVYSDTAKTNLFAQSDGSSSFSAGTVFTFIGTPQAAPSESLTNGKSRDVGQLNIALADTNLWPDLPINIYAKSTDLISTDGKDSKSAFSGTVGLQHGLFPWWYSPIYLEQGVQGNQTASNLSTVTNLGISGTVPWQWSAGFLNTSHDPIINAPLPPDLTLVNQYNHRINQLVTAKSPRLSNNDYSLNPSLSWKSITSPVTCKIFDWLNRSKGGYCLGTEINLGMWYLPLDLTASKAQKVEGYGDVSILLPLAGFSFASKVFPYITSSDPTKVQIRIKYSDSVNAANNYARTRGWSYGMEVLK